MKFQAACMGAKIEDEIPQQEMSDDQLEMTEKIAREQLQKRGFKQWQTPT